MMQAKLMAGGAPRPRLPCRRPLRLQASSSFGPSARRPRPIRRARPWLKAPRSRFRAATSSPSSAPIARRPCAARAISTPSRSAWPRPRASAAASAPCAPPKSPRIPSIWDIDATQSGKVCVDRHVEAAIVAARQRPPKRRSISAPADGAVQPVTWAPASSSIAWPAGLALTSGAEYQIEWHGHRREEQCHDHPGPGLGRRPGRRGAGADRRTAARTSSTCWSTAPARWASNQPVTPASASAWASASVEAEAVQYRRPYARPARAAAGRCRRARRRAGPASRPAARRQSCAPSRGAAPGRRPAPG